MKQQPLPKQSLKPNFYYRCRPTLYESAVIGSYLADLDGTSLQLFNLKDFSLKKSFEVLDKEDQYSAKMHTLNDKYLSIFGTQKFVIVNVEEEKVIEVVKVDGYIECSEIWNDYIVVLTTDEESESKLITCWKFNEKQCKLTKISKPTSFQVPEFQECCEQNLKISIIISVDNNPRVYIYWKDTIHMIEVDPLHQLSERYARNSYVTFVSDLNQKTYAEIVQNKIHVHEKKGGKRIAQLMNEGESFQKLFPSKKEGQLYSLSKSGIKCWKLQLNSTPTFYAGSQKYNIQKLFFTQQEVIGINSQTNNIMIWSDSNECQTNSFPNEIIRTMLKLNQDQVIFLLEATASSEDENEHHVQKHNKLQIYDFAKDIQIAKKAMNQSKFSVEMDSLIVCENETIRFIVREDEGGESEDYKKYLIRWTPFQKDQSQKDTKKKQIKGAKNFNHLKLYPFNRILGIKSSKKVESYSLFGKGEEESKTQIVLYDFSAKKFGDYDLEGDIFNAEVSMNDLIYAIGGDRVAIYKINTTNKNSLEKIQELQISALFMKPIDNMLLIRKQESFILFSEEFDLLMNEDVDDDDYNYKVLPQANGNFYLKTDKTLTHWNVKKQETKRIEVGECRAKLTQLLDGKLMCIQKWIKSYDLNKI